MNRVEIVIEVFCSNKQCKHFLMRKKPRFIGDDYGGGGRWPCESCGKWTIRERIA